MAIFFTGDIHGEWDVRRLGAEFFPIENLTKDDYLVICGDFGFIWDDEPTEYENRWLKWLEDRPWTTLFVDGNHENHVRLLSMPVSEWCGGKVHCINDSVIHLMRGQVFDIDGKRVFTMGGAKSDDQEYRLEGESWWCEEIPSLAEREEALANLNACGWVVDYVVTHCAPSDLVEGVSYYNWYHPADEYSRWLQAEVFEKLSFDAWCFGHYHCDEVYEDPETGQRMVNVYYKVYDPIQKKLMGKGA